MVVPPLTALLSDASGEALGDLGPVFGPLRDDNTGQDLVLLLGPGALRKVTAVVELEPAGVALDLRLAAEELADAIPGVLPKAINIAEQLFILYTQSREGIRALKWVECLGLKKNFFVVLI